MGAQATARGLVPFLWRGATVVFEGEWMYVCVHVRDSASAGACVFPWNCGVFSDGEKGTRRGLKCDSWGILQPLLSLSVLSGRRFSMLLLLLMT